MQPTPRKGTKYSGKLLRIIIVVISRGRVCSDRGILLLLPLIRGLTLGSVILSRMATPSRYTLLYWPRSGCTSQYVYETYLFQCLSQKIWLACI